MWVRAHTDVGAKPSTIRRRLSALSSWYRYLATHDVIAPYPVAGVCDPGLIPITARQSGWTATKPAP